MKQKKVIVGVIIGAIIFYLISSFIVDRRLSELESRLDTDINKQLELVANTATLLGRGGASESVATIVPECLSLDVARYDSLLSSLDRGLAEAELLELKSLFDRCGDIASARRALMTMTLTEQVATLELLVLHYQSLEKKLSPENLVEEWKQLVHLEQEISNNFNQLVVAQGNIIAALISDTPSSSLTVENIRVEAEELRGQLTQLTSDAAPLRSRLVKS